MQRITTYINLFVTGQCQHMCWYCVEGCQTNRIRPHMDDKTFMNVLDFIEAQDGDDVVLHFYGGEPLLHPRLSDYVEAALNRLDSVSFRISTNLNHGFDRLCKLSPYFDVRASLHTDFVKDYVGWFANAQWVKSNCNSIVVSLMMQKRNIVSTLTLYDMWRHYFPVEIYPIDQFKNTGEYKRVKQLTKFNEHVEDNAGWKGCMCNAGWDIDEAGNVTKCSGVKATLLNVNERIEKLNKWSVCFNASECPCDIEFEKVAMREYIRRIK